MRPVKEEIWDLVQYSVSSSVGWSVRTYIRESVRFPVEGSTWWSVEVPVNNQLTEDLD